LIISLENLSSRKISKKPKFSMVAQLDQENEWNVFVSYSRSDRDYVAPIVDLLRVTGSKVFRDEDWVKNGG
jgi:hypothetical protein